MSVFSTNQARHLYVANKEGLGNIKASLTDDKKCLYFEYEGPGGKIRSDLIDIDSIMYAKITDADKMSRSPKNVRVTLPSGSTPIPGQDYILKIVFNQFAGMSNEDTYTKFGMAHATTGMTASDLYKELAFSLVKNFSREAIPLVTISLVTSAGEEEVSSESTPSSFDGTYTGIKIEEVEQPWVLGIMPQVPVLFEVQPGTIIDGGDEVIWGKIENGENPSKKINNGKAIADLEHFCMGERGDVYRGMGYPNSIPTKYMVDPTAAYHVLDIHYAYVGSNEAVQKSEKDITIVSTDKTILDGLLAVIYPTGGN